MDNNLKIKIPYYNKVVGQLKLDCRAAIIIINIPTATLFAILTKNK